MTERALLVDVDSVIPNLALMHISTWRKEAGVQTGFHIEDPTEVWASVVFQKNRHKVDGLRWFYPDAKIDIGGTGVDPLKHLPEEVDRLMPDYSLYPEMDYDLGFTSRGCNRKCLFCFVPRKEGRFRIHQHPSEFHVPEHKKVKLLDNNLLFDKEWFYEVTDWILKEDLEVEFNQGLDIRLIDRDVQARLKQLRIWKTMHFAFDDMDYRDDVEKGLAILRDAGIRLRNIGFYVYVGGDGMFEDALQRCNILREWGTTAYVMVDPSYEITQRIRDLKRWSRPMLFYSMDFAQYNRTIGH